MSDARLDRSPTVSPVPDSEDQAATAAFVRAHGGWMLRAAFAYLSDQQLAEDAVQNAFSKVFAKADQLADPAMLNGWIRRIVVNEALMILRKRRSLREDDSIDPLLPTFDAGGIRIDDTAAPPMDPEAILMGEEARQRVLAAIAELPPRYRAVLLLRDVEELSTREVAESLGINEGNVKVRLHRARAALRSLLEPQLAGRRAKP